MKRISLIIALAIAFVTLAHANDSVATNDSGMEYKVAVGFNIGGTSPIGLPAEVRSINSYMPTANLSIAGYAVKMFNSAWGLKAGLRFENKGMEAGIGVKNYKMTVNVQSGDEVGVKTGYFTGDIKNKTRMGYVSVPVSAVYRLNKRWDFHAGVYVAYAIDANFTGEVVQGRIRETPLTPIVSVNQADYDYSGDLQRWDVGAEIGASCKVYRNLAIDAHFTWGLMSVLDPDKRKMDMDNYNLYLNLGLSYTF